MRVPQSSQSIKNHITNHSDIMAPIIKLTKYNEPFIRGELQQNAFKEAKAVVANTILCMYPDLNMSIIIYPNTLQKYAMGAMLP